MLQLLFLTLLSTAAHATYTIEGPPSAERTDAVALSKSTRDIHRGKVVRRFVDGEGWEYLVRWTFSDQASAFEAAPALAISAKSEVVVFDDAGKRVEAGIPTQSQATGPVRDWVGEAAEKHGNAAAVLAETDRLRVTFTRVVDGKEVMHTYIRSGTDVALNIKGVKGEVVDSTTIAAGDTAWLIADGKTTKEDLQRTRERIESFGPTSLIPFVLDLDTMAKSYPQLANMAAKGSTQVGPILCEVAGTEDDKTLIAFGPKGLVHRISLADHARVVAYADYQLLEDTMVPRTITTFIDGKERDTIKITSIELGAAIADDLFKPPT